jgi:molybdate transport system regulatory protein
VVLVDEINRICGDAAVETQEGGKHGGGAKLTPPVSLWWRAIERSNGRWKRSARGLLALRADIGASKAKGIE